MTGTDFTAVSIPKGFEDYLEAILWVSEMDGRSVYEFSEKAIAKLLDYYSRFTGVLSSLGLLESYLEAYDIWQLGHDFALEQLRTGCGFVDRTLLSNNVIEMICMICNCFPEFNVYESEDEIGRAHV